MKKFIFLISLFLFNLGIAQQVLIEDFTTTTGYTYAGFEGLASASIVADPASGGTRGNGLQLVNQSTGNPWQGAEVLFATKKMNLTTDKTVKVDVYSTQAFTMLAKVENGAPASATSMSYTTPGSWQTLTFTFTNGLDGTVPANGEYQKIVFFGNWKADNTGFNNPPANFTFHVDNIMAELVVVAPDPVPLVSATNPTQPNTDVVLSLFNDKPGFTNAYAVEGEFGTRTLINLDAENDQTIKMNFSVAGWGQYNNTTVNLSTANYLNFDYYVPNVAAGVNGHGFFIMINSGSGEKLFTVKPSGGNATMAFDSWQTVSIPMSHFTAQGFNPATFLVWKLGTDSDLNTKLVYFDNIYFTQSLLGVKDVDVSKNKLVIYPNPVSAGEMISVNENVKSLEIFDINGRKVKSTSSAKVSSQGLSKGVYLIKATNDKGEITTNKLIIK